MFLSTKVAGAFLTALAGLALLGTQARADLQFNSSNIVGGLFSYNLNFNNSIDLSTGSHAQRLQAGNFATIYDIQDFNGAVLDPAFASLFTLSTAPLGITPPGILPGDDTLTNVTLTYKGPTVTADQSFTNILQISTLSNTVSLNGQYAGATTINTGAAAGLPVGNIGTVAVPGISTSITPPETPEPGSIAFLVTAGVSGSAFFLRRRRRK